MRMVIHFIDMGKVKQTMDDPFLMVPPERWWKFQCPCGKTITVFNHDRTLKSKNTIHCKGCKSKLVLKNDLVMM